MDDEEYQLQGNNGSNTLNGSFDGLHFQICNIEVHLEGSIAFIRKLPDRKDGFCGNRNMKVSLSPDKELVTDYWRTTDRKTVLNLIMATFLYGGIRYTKYIFK